MEHVHSTHSLLKLCIIGAALAALPGVLVWCQVEGGPKEIEHVGALGGSLDANMLDLSLGHFALLNHSSFEGSTLFLGYVFFFDTTSSNGLPSE